MKIPNKIHLDSNPDEGLTRLIIKKHRACVRCGGTGSANHLTYPDQSYRNGCRLCNGTGKICVNVQAVDTCKNK